jgi:hypothetical protein
MLKRLLCITFALVLIVGALPVTAAGAGAAVGNGNFTLIGDAFMRDDGTVQLTGTNYYEAGGLWLQNPLETARFSSIEFEFMMIDGTGYENQGIGADGITVSFAPELPDFLLPGEEMGFYGPGAFGVEFDTFLNDHRFDPPVCHIAIIQDSVSNHLTAESGLFFNDSYWHNAKIFYINGVVSVYFDGELLLEQAIGYESDSFYLGISAATGGCVQYHLVKNVRLEYAVNAFAASAEPKDFISMKETSKNSGIWVLSFLALKSYADGTSEYVRHDVSLDGNNANLKGEYIFTNGPLAGYTLVYDIKGNGSNIKELRLIK